MITIEEHRSDTEIIIVLSGSLVAGAIETVRNRLKTLIDDGAMQITFELSGVDVIDSAGIGLVAATYNTLTKKGGTIKVVELSDEMYQFFIGLRLNSHFTVEQKKN